MKFIFSDSLDYVDPHYDFINDQNGPGRAPYWDDKFPHEIMSPTPYDGILVSRAVVGDPGMKGHYSESQAMRFRRIGAREFLRFNDAVHKDMMVMGDNGAFSYVRLASPPFSAADTVEFYASGKFTHGCSVDHIIFEFDANAKGLNGGSEESQDRYEITLQLALEFHKESLCLGTEFTPIGVIQGWSPDSMAAAAAKLVKIGYRYLAIGGLVPLGVAEIHRAVSAVHDAVSRWPSVKIHLLGFAKADHLHEFTQYKKIASFDSSSPLIRAFKDKRNNFYLPDDTNGGLKYYTAIRIPQATDNIKLKNHAKSGHFNQEKLIGMEKNALSKLRAFAKNRCGIEETLDSIIEYSRPLHWTPSITEEALKRAMHNLRLQYKRTLEDRPWTHCKCNICKDAGVDVLIFRASNRNKRRGIHNLGVYHKHLQRINSL